MHRLRLPPRHAFRAIAAILLLLAATGCSKKVNAPSPTPRTYRMGFSGIPPRADLDLLLASIAMWSQRADAAIMHVEPPWDSLLAGVHPDTLIRHEPLPLADYYRALGLDLVITVDLTDGLNRASEAPALMAAGRSLTEPVVQQLARDYIVTLNSLLNPSHLGIGAETNLIRAVAPSALYQAVVQTANAAAADVRVLDATVKLYASVQVEVAWGRLVGPGGTYEGIATDLTDFPFIQEIGLSSYPYLGGFTEPEELPADYYSRLAQGTNLPVLVVEGGWTSATVDAIESTPEKQARYITRQIQLVDAAGAVGLFQLTFTDLDPSIFPPGSILPYFAHLGLVDVDLNPKPSLAHWDAAFARPLR